VSCGWEGNRRSGVALTMTVCLYHLAITFLLYQYTGSWLKMIMCMAAGCAPVRVFILSFLSFLLVIVRLV